LNYFNYFTEIEETFIRRRGRNLLLSPLDWALIEEWQEREIPLHIILRAIETVFDTVDRQPARKRAVKSLSYCKEEVEAQFAEWAEMQAGRQISGSKPQDAPKDFKDSSNSDGELFSPDAVEIHLEKAVSELETAKEKAAAGLKETFERVLARLRELQQKLPPAEKLEESLEKLDAMIDQSLLDFSESERLAALKKELEKNLAAYKNKMEPEVYERTFDLMLTKRLRDEAGIPRLSLFYI
jgi:hypothetical protein